LSEACLCIRKSKECKAKQRKNQVFLRSAEKAGADAESLHKEMGLAEEH